MKEWLTFIHVYQNNLKSSTPFIYHENNLKLGRRQGKQIFSIIYPAEKSFTQSFLVVNRPCPYSFVNQNFSWCYILRKEEFEETVIKNLEQFKSMQNFHYT